MDIQGQTRKLIDDLKAVCKDKGLGNDGNEYKIIVQVFLYKFLCDKFAHAVKQINEKLKNAEKWELEYEKMSDEERQEIFDMLDASVPKLQPYHLISYLWNNQTKGDFDILFDETLVDIAEFNKDIFSTQTADNTKIKLFEKLTIYVTDNNKRTEFARALIDKLVNFSFEETFNKKYDFFANIFEYLIKDYNTSGGGTYAEYYTPHSIATIIARLLVHDNSDLKNMECYDPSAGTGTLLMAIAHQIGEEKCTIFSQDISQKSQSMLKLNLILNNLVSSLDNIIQGNTLVSPYHKNSRGDELKQFDFVVSNPPFKMDFSETRDILANMPARFWAGVPNVPNKDKKKMAIYTCFIQHVINSLKNTGKGAIVVPTGFITASSGVERKVLEYIINNNIIYGCVSMPANVFANTGTNVSILFFDKSKQQEKVVLIDASNLGEEYKEGDNKKIRLLEDDINKIVNTFHKKEAVKEFSVVVTYDEIKENNYSLSAGQYFDVEIEYIDITEEEFNKKMETYQNNLQTFFAESRKLENEILESLGKIQFERLNNE